MLVSTDSASPKYIAPVDSDVEEAVRAGTAAGQSASVGVTSPPSSAGAGQAQSSIDIAVSAQAYVQLPQLVDCISPYTAVDTA